MPFDYQGAPQPYLDYSYDKPQASNKLKPIFCFEYISRYMSSNGDYCLNCDKKTKDQASDLLDKISMLSQKTWQEISQLPKDTGFEKIPLKSMSGVDTYKKLLGKDADLLVFRLKRSKDTARFMGIRHPKNQQIFQICMFDKKGKAYSH